MLNLAIECSGFHGSVALCRNGQVLTQKKLDSRRASVQTLASAVDDLVRSESRVELVSVVVGPGSFTGLRVGLATAKMLAFAWQIPISGVDALAVIARNLTDRSSEPTREEVVVACMNAFRNQVFAAAWLRQESEGWSQAVESKVVDASAWSQAPVESLGNDILGVLPQSRAVITGPGLEVYRPVHPRWRLADQEFWYPRAAQVGQIGWEQFELGLSVNARDCRPNYVRASAAEEKQAQEKESPN